MSFEARYHGTCHSCDEHISPGQMCTYGRDDDLIHVDCEGSAPKDPLAPERAICMTCFTELPVSMVCGTCDE